jgi:indolepyruvate ferredoxin oxidoreductase beta subunit
MNELSPARLSTDRPICLAILAMGGQGGGVLADWIVALAEAQGFHVQSTSVPGVAQRTGATIYYIELLKGGGAVPVLSLMPTPGEVDVVIAAELMEGGRAMLRGLVTPDRTTLIASTHRSLSVAEKSVPGDGAGDPNVVTLAAGIAAKRVIAFDMQTMAEAARSMISAAMFGALAGAGALPFTRDAFESAIRAGGKGVEPSLRAFAAGFDAANAPKPSETLRRAPDKRHATPSATGHAVLDALLTRIRTDFADPVQPMLLEGVRRLVDYQDPDYAAAYLDRVAGLAMRDPLADHAVSLAAAKYIATAMAYDDPIRVADLKTRGSRAARVRGEMGVAQEQPMATTEFMHPRGEEVVGLLPAGLGRAIQARPMLFRVIDRIVNRPRRVRTTRVLDFLLLYAVAGRRPARRGTLRHQEEMAHIAAWLALTERVLPANPRLAAEILATRRLVKGYSDTHARGAAKFDRVLSAVPLLEPRADGAAWLRRLREAALADEAGTTLDGALRTVASLDVPA